MHRPLKLDGTGWNFIYEIAMFSKHEKGEYFWTFKQARAEKDKVAITCLPEGRYITSTHKNIYIWNI